MTGRKILIVDDESAIRDMLRVALEMAEYQVMEASNAQDAHGLIIDEKPDLKKWAGIELPDSRTMRLANCASLPAGARCSSSTIASSHGAA